MEGKFDLFKSQQLEMRTHFTKTILTSQCRQRLFGAGKRKAEQRTPQGVVGSRLRVLAAMWESAQSNSVEASQWSGFQSNLLEQKCVKAGVCFL